MEALRGWALTVALSALAGREQSRPILIKKKPPGRRGSMSRHTSSAIAEFIHNGKHLVFCTFQLNGTHVTVHAIANCASLAFCKNSLTAITSMGVVFSGFVL